MLVIKRILLIIIIFSFPIEIKADSSNQIKLKLFFKDLKVYLYPLKDPETGEITTSDSVKVHPRMKELYKFFKNNGRLINIDDFDPETLDIFSRTVLKMIVNGDKGWEEMLPEGIPEIIKQKRLFGYSKTSQINHRKKAYEMVLLPTRRDRNSKLLGLVKKRIINLSRSFNSII